MSVRIGSKSHTAIELVPKLVTSNDLERTATVKKHISLSVRTPQSKNSAELRPQVDASDVRTSLLNILKIY